MYIINRNYRYFTVHQLDHIRVIKIGTYNYDPLKIPVPERWMMGALREELEMLHADVVFVTPQYFEHDNSKFTQQLRRDYKELKI